MKKVTINGKVFEMDVRMKFLGFKKRNEKSATSKQDLKDGFPKLFDAYYHNKTGYQYVIDRQTNKWEGASDMATGQNQSSHGTGYDTLMKHAEKKFNTEVTVMKSTSKKATKKATNRKAHAKASSKKVAKKAVTKRDGNYREGSVTQIIFAKLKGGAKKKIDDLSKGVKRDDQKHIPYVLRRLNRHSKSLGMKFIKHDDGSVQMKRAS